MSGLRQRLQAQVNAACTLLPVVDSPAFPQWDVSMPARNSDLAAEVLRCLRDATDVAATALGSGFFVHVRWTDEALMRILREVGPRHPGGEGAVDPRASMRIAGLARMAAIERPFDLEGKPVLDRRARDLAVRLEWLLSAERRTARRRLRTALAADFHSWYEQRALLRGPADLLRGRLLVCGALSCALADDRDES